MTTSLVSSPQELYPILLNPFNRIRENHAQLETMLDRAEDIVLRLSQYDLGIVKFLAWVNDFCESPKKNSDIVNFSLVTCIYADNSLLLPSIFIIQTQYRNEIELKWSRYPNSAQNPLIRSGKLYTTNPVADILKIWSSLIKEAGEK